MWKVIGVATGVIVANLFIFGCEWTLVHAGWVATRGVDGIDDEYLLQTGALAVQVMIIVGWMLGAALGAMAAFVLARSDWTGWIVAGWVAVITAFGSLGMYPHPLWLKLSALALPFVGTVVAFGLYRRWRALRLHLRR